MSGAGDHRKNTTLHTYARAYECVSWVALVDERLECAFAAYPWRSFDPEVGLGNAEQICNFGSSLAFCQ